MTISHNNERLIFFLTITMINIIEFNFTNILIKTI